MSPVITRWIPAVLVAVAPLFIAGCSSSNSDKAYSSRRAVVEELRALQESNVVVIVSASNRVMVNGSQAKPEELGEVFASFAKEFPGRPVVLYVQVGTDQKAEAYVRRQATKSGLGPVTATWLD